MTVIPKRIAIVCGDFHADIAATMISAAEDEATSAGVNAIQIVKIPGSYEAPLVTDRLLATATEAVIVLGYIEKGETLHGEIMGRVVHQALIDLQIKHQKPIGFGIIGPGATRQQAEARHIDYARAAVRAALRSYQTLQSL